MLTLNDLPSWYWDRVHPCPVTGCWHWAGSLNPVSGYAQRSDGKWGTVHRFVCEATHGPVPVGMVVDHKCNNKGCVNPDHVRPLTQRENLLRAPTSQAGKRAAQTHCKRGHLLAGDNVYRRANGTRNCIACSRSANASRMASIRMMR